MWRPEIIACSGSGAANYPSCHRAVGGEHPGRVGIHYRAGIYRQTTIHAHSNTHTLESVDGERKPECRKRVFLQRDVKWSKRLVGEAAVVPLYVPSGFTWPYLNKGRPGSINEQRTWVQRSPLDVGWAISLSVCVSSAPRLISLCTSYVQRGRWTGTDRAGSPQGIWRHWCLPS